MSNASKYKRKSFYDSYPESFWKEFSDKIARDRKLYTEVSTKEKFIGIIKSFKKGMKEKIFLVREIKAEVSTGYFGSNLRYLRKKMEWSQEYFSDKVGVKRSVIGSYEEERAEPDLLSFHRICKLFNVTMENMLTKDLSKS
jgi:DNA-binding XRE family transcriptional regulator